MEEILNKKVQYGAKIFFKASQSARTQDKSDEAMKLFRMRQGYFHFLLATDIWNHERNVYQRSHTSIEYNTQRTEGAPDIQDLARRNSEYTSNVPRENLVNQAGKLNTILGRLNALHCKDMHRRTLLLRQPDTCTWLPKTNEFKTWRKTKDSFLWLHGKAGAGKSVLTASVIEHLENTLQDGKPLLFFYCDFRNERSTITAEVLRSLLSQLLQLFIHHAIQARGLIDDLEKEGGLIVNDLVLLARYISRAVQHFSQQPICVIDALDECNDIEELLDALIQLKNGGIRLFVTSRSLQVIREGLTGLPSISMDQMSFDVAADIALHVERELDSHRRLRILDTNLKNEIGSALCDKANGMFRWVHCQLSSLKRCMTTVQIRKTLDELPCDLDDTYSRILVRIDENEWEVVRQALYWLVAAFRPLKLCQILEGLSIDPVRRVLDHDSAPIHGPALLDAFGSLVTYDELTDRVVLSHASVKEYLIAESTHSKYPSYLIGERDAHTKLALLCMSYIPAYLKQRQQSAVPPQNAYSSRTRADGFNFTYHAIRHRRSSLPSSSEPYPLLAYIQSSGFQHLGHVDPADRKVLRAIETFQSDVRLHPTEWEQLRKRPHTLEFHLQSPEHFQSGTFKIRWPTLEHDLVLYILIAFAPAQLLRLYIGHTRLKQKVGTNPLIYAALNHKREHATILLSKGARVECKGWNLSGLRQILPLEAAVTMSNPQMVDLFLTEGSPVPCELFDSIVENKRRFSARVILKLLQSDEFVEWATTAADNKLLLCVLYPVFVGEYSSEEDIEAMERRLIQIGCDPSVRFDETSLCHAVRSGHISIVKRMLFNGDVPLPSDTVLHATSWEMISFLLDLGNNIHVTSSGGDTLLHLVIKTSKQDQCLETIQALVEAGCNPSACNLAGETPIHAAVRHGEFSVVEYLLSLDLPLPPDILLATSNSSMILFLLDEGANVHAIAADGNTVLHVAMQHSCYDEVNWDQCLVLAKLLVNAGCNPSSPNVFGETPLHVAAKGGHLPVVQYFLSLDVPLPPIILLSVVGAFTSMATPLINFLLDYGADVHAMSPNGDNLLCVSVADSKATEEECLRRIKILLSAGCDPHVCNKAGESLGYVAARRSYTAVLQYLVSIGLPVPPNVLLAQFDEHRLLGNHSQITRFVLDKLGGDMCAIVLNNGDTLLHLVQPYAATEKDALDLAKFLVQSGCSPSAFNSKQETPFHIASQCGYISVISYFLSLGASLPSNILFAAVSAGYLCRARVSPVIRYLIQQGADATSTDAGDTPLHRLLASIFQHSEHDCLRSAKILIEAGCDPQSQDLDMKTPMHLAARRGYISVIEYLLSRGIPPPCDILFDSTAKALRFFIRIGVDIQNFVAIFPLHCALDSVYLSEEDRLEHARILINAGCDPSLQNSLGKTPIHIAAGNNHIAIVKYLLSQNAALPSDVLLDVAPKEKFWYMQEESILLLRFLIHEGADANASTYDGNTPLHLAIRHTVDLEGGQDRYYHDFIQRRVCRCTEVLLNGGANPFAPNADGKSAFDLAEEKGQLFKDNFLRLVRNGSRNARSSIGLDLPTDD